jgi:carbon-monoxide dehydrogenase medium subunit
LKLDRYIRAASLEECVQYLIELGNSARLLAGGTDLIPRIRQGKLSVSTLIDLSHIPELSGIAEHEKGVVIGSMCRLRAIQNAPFPGALGVLSQCAGHVSSMQVRNVATLGGNICNASPAADTIPGLLILDAVALVSGKQGARETPLESFFTGPGSTVLAPDEMLTGILLPRPLPSTGAAYRKYTIRGDSDVSIVGAGAKLTLDADGRVSEARVALASVGDRPLRMKREEQMLLGALPDEALLKAVSASCAESCSPITDQRATKEYRREMVQVWTEDALKGALVPRNV